MTARPRLDPGPLEELDRAQPLRLTFDGRAVAAFEGDTVASALAAAGIDVISRSFKYHRPRGLLCCAGRCPNCLVEVDGTPNVRACTTPARARMRVRSQNARPSLRWDVMALTDRFDRFLPIGFYYKTFIRPRFLWPLYEWVLRHAAGLGRIDVRARPALHARKRHLHCDVAVIGGGPAGCLAALEAAALGARVILVDDQPRLGGHLRIRSRAVDGGERLAAGSGFEAAERLAAEVAAEGRIEHLAAATAIGIYEGGLIGVSQGETFVRVRAKQIVVAAGAAERPALFDGNDRPGVMLASAVLALRHRHGVAAGTRAIVVTDHDHGLRAVAELVAAGIGVVAVIDQREDGWDEDLAGDLRSGGTEVLADTVPLASIGSSAVRGLRVSTPGGERTIDADLIAMAIRPEPVIALLAQAGAKTRFDEHLGQFVATAVPDGIHAAGRVLGVDDDALVVSGAVIAGRMAASAANGRAVGDGEDLTAARAALELRVEAAVTARHRPPPLAVASGRKQFVCLCEDVTTKELAQGVAEGFADLETLKRYSTVTMGPCQGKMCHGIAARVHARLTDSSPARTGLTTARPPFQPISLAALAGPHLAPIRRTAMHEQHERLGARWVDMGDWKRPFAYGDVNDEVRAVREAAGIIDVSTLGKLDVQGADAGAFLDWLHPNRFSDLRPGRVRYRAMLDDAGIVLDDGTVARLGDERFFVSTTTGNIEAVEQWLGWWLADGARDVSVTNVTSEFAAVNLAGPRARDILANVTDLDISREAMPYLAAAQGQVAGVPAIILRIGFVGELGFEIHVPADNGAHVWDALVAAGAEHGLRPFGVEAQRVLRLEKQHAIVGQDTDALSNPLDSGMGWLVKADKPDFIGRDAAGALGDGRDGRLVLTGFEILGVDVPAEGAAIVRDGRAVGRVTSAKWSPTLGRPIGLAWLEDADAVDGAPLTIRLGVGADGFATVGRVRREPFYDPAGERLRS